MALWPTVADNPIDPMEHWCSEASGVGTFLVRLWLATGDRAFLDCAEGAATCGVPPQVARGTGHMLRAGRQREFLLDLFAATGVERYRDLARELARSASLRCAERDGRLLVPDETGSGFGAQYGVGLVGFAAFLCRLGTVCPDHGRSRQ